MAIDTSLVMAVLRVLSRLGENALPETTLASECDLDQNKTHTMNQIRDAVRFCIDEGWVEQDEDTFKRDVFKITDAGRAQL